MRYAVLSVAASLLSLVKPSVAEDDFWKPGPIRDVVFVYDEFRTPNVSDQTISPTGDHVYYPAHAWLLFGRTALDGPLRLEIVAPTINGEMEGLAIKVTDYTNTRDDEGQPDWPLPAHTHRETHRYAKISTLRNDQIFDPRSLMRDYIPNSRAPPGEMPPLTGLEYFWTAKPKQPIQNSITFALAFASLHELFPARLSRRHRLVRLRPGRRPHPRLVRPETRHTPHLAPARPHRLPLHQIPLL
jgi:hypothetical protein